MIMSTIFKTLLAALFAGFVLGASALHGQEPSAGKKDDDLDGFLKKLDDSAKPAPPAAKPAADSKSNASEAQGRRRLG